MCFQNTTSIVEKPMALCIESDLQTTILSAFHIAECLQPHYQKLRQFLTERICFPTCDGLEKNGDFRICTDFWWMNARTIKDAHPLPHQSDCLAAIGGNTIFSTMEVFITCPCTRTRTDTKPSQHHWASFMRMMVFPPFEQEALNKLEIVFQRLREHNLKLSPKQLPSVATVSEILPDTWGSC